MTLHTGAQLRFPVKSRPNVLFSKALRNRHSSGKSSDWGEFLPRVQGQLDGSSKRERNSRDVSKIPGMLISVLGPTSSLSSTSVLAQLRNCPQCWAKTRVTHDCDP